MVLTVSNLYKLAMTLEKDSEVIELHKKYNSGKQKKEHISLPEFVIDCINYASLTDYNSLFENDSLILSTYNGRIYYVGEEDGIERNKYISNDTLKKHKITKDGEEFIKKYIPSFGEKKPIANNRPRKKDTNKKEKKPNKEKTEGVSTEDKVEE